MFEWLFGKTEKKLEAQTKEGFNSVKKDMDAVGKWIKHLDVQDKQLFNMLNDLKSEISSIKEDMDGFKEAFEMSQGMEKIAKNKQLFEKKAVLGKQTAVQAVQEPVQTAVQTGNFYEIFKSFSGNEKLIVRALLESEMKLSYEDLALLLGKERATIRGQVNSIKQKVEGLIEEIIEKNGKKRVFIPNFWKEKLSKFAKVRVSGGKKGQKKDEKTEKSESIEENEQ